MKEKTVVLSKVENTFIFLLFFVPIIIGFVDYVCKNNFQTIFSLVFTTELFITILYMMFGGTVAIKD